MANIKNYRIVTLPVTSVSSPHNFTQVAGRKGLFKSKKAKNDLKVKGKVKKNK